MVSSSRKSKTELIRDLAVKLEDFYTNELLEIDEANCLDIKEMACIGSTALTSLVACHFVKVSQEISSIRHPEIPVEKIHAVAASRLEKFIRIVNAKMVEAQNECFESIGLGKGGA